MYLPPTPVPDAASSSFPFMLTKQYSVRTKCHELCKYCSYFRLLRCEKNSSSQILYNCYSFVFLLMRFLLYLFHLVSRNYTLDFLGSITN